MKISVLGGSTPFVLPLIDELRTLPPGSLRLHGRDPGALSATSEYARLSLEKRGWSVCGTTDLTKAVEGAEVIVHQIRYGGLLGRERDEQLAAALGMPADETLGPAGLQAALRAAPDVRDLAGLLRSTAPQALVLNLTNPLSVTTALFAAAGLSVWGLCELPELTQRRIATLIDVPAAALHWHYHGLNHRGFLHHLEVRGCDVLGSVIRQAEHLDGGISAQDIAETQAVPLKYWGLRRGLAPHGAGRAAELMSLRAEALHALRESPSTWPAALAGREMPWYARSVGPVLQALATNGKVSSVVNLPGPDGIVREHRVTMIGRWVDILAAPDPPAPVTRWIERFEAHERAVLTAVHNPDRTTVAEALALDPLLAPPDPQRAAAAINPAD